VLCRLFSANAGWITLRTESGEQQLAAVRGLPPALSANDFSALRWTPCRCQSMLLRDGLDAPRIITCDRLELASGDTGGLRHHATTVLRDGEQALGLLHIALGREDQLTGPQASVLDAAGRMIGLALKRLSSAGQDREATEQTALLALTSKLLSLLDADQIASETVRILSETFPCPVLDVLTFEPQSRSLVLRASTGLGDRSGRYRVSIDDRNDPLAAVARDLKAAVLSEGSLLEFAKTSGIRSMAAVPMSAAGKLIGLLVVGAQEPARFTERDLGFLSLAADQCALAFDRTRLLTSTRRQVRDLAALHEQAAAQTRQLSETYGATLAVLGDALELRDEDTMGHTERVVGLAVSLGRQLGLSQEDLMHLEWGAYVHDLGKIGVPDAVLRKPGPLSPDEWKLMQRHPEQGYTLLQRLLFLSRSLDVVRFHHERFDGKGYPMGLKGDEIPLLARIFAVADAYDAMTNDRPYRRAMSAGEALAEIQRNRGSQFDPAVVDALGLLPEAERAPLRRAPLDVPETVARESVPPLMQGPCCVRMIWRRPWTPLSSRSSGDSGTPPAPSCSRNRQPGRCSSLHTEDTARMVACSRRIRAWLSDACWNRRPRTTRGMWREPPLRIHSAQNLRCHFPWTERCSACWTWGARSPTPSLIRCAASSKPSRCWSRSRSNAPGTTRRCSASH
jgi:HD-GYP domain-containing protein (c-di-GMP phosphodiesterase class II)